MGRIKEIEVAGKKLTLNFSTKAAKAVDERFGGIEQIGEVFSGDTVAGIMENIVWFLYLLTEQGAAYSKIVNGEEVAVYSLEELEVLVGFSDIMEMQNVLLDAIGMGMEAEVKVETDEKNEETTQAS